MGTPKSRKSRRVVPLDGWLAELMAAYLPELGGAGRHIGSSERSVFLAVQHHGHDRPAPASTADASNVLPFRRQSAG